MEHQDELVFKIQGMDCAGCARSIENGVRQLTGVQDCALNFTTETLRVTGEVNRQNITQRIENLGFKAVEPSRQPSPPSPDLPTNFFRFMWQRTDSRLALLGAILILPGLLLEELLLLHHPLIDITSLVAMVIAGGPIAHSAWRAIRYNREININVLMTIAAIGAVIIGAYTEAGMVMVLFAIGETLEGYTANRARNSIRSLMTVMPSLATRLQCCDNQAAEEIVKIADLHVGDIILVKPGERIPMDGRIQAGQSLVNQAPITGESKLAEKQVGTKVFASSINGEGALEVKVTHLAKDNTISRIIKMVEEAQERQAPSQRFIDQFAKYYTPTVVILAILVATVPPLFFNQPFWNPDAETFGWFYRSLALLVVACPCALVISTPVTIISAISNAARQGILIKGGAFLELLSQIQVMAFDKTGTLTRGQPNIVAIRTQHCDTQTPHGEKDCAACEDMLALATAVEQRSEHPLAQAIVQAATERGIQNRYPAATMTQTLTGLGVTGQIDGQEILIGSHAYFEQLVPHGASACQTAQADTQQGYTPLMVAQSGTYLGTISVADTIRESSRDALAQLKRSGLQTLVMLTGDDKNVADKIAQTVGGIEVKAELLPQDKLAAIQDLQAKQGLVAMVGDGINDAPALAAADVGIAIGAGTDQALETADIALMNNDLQQLAVVRDLSQRAMQTIRVNVGLSMGIKAAFVVLTVLGLSTMWMAVLADMGTSLMVTVNGMRLLNHKLRNEKK